ncbi:MAG: nucleoside hydrolase [Dysgonomonas sp.]
MKKFFLLLIAVPLLLASCGGDKDNSQASAENKKSEEKTVENKKVKMILDLDTGVDDAMALAYAIGSPNIELIGVTTVYGNVSRDTSIKNTLALLDLLGKKDIPVYAGNDRPTGAKEAYKVDQIVEEIHGKNGIGNIEIPASTRSVEKESAMDFMIESAKKYGKDLYIVATGPETNLAQVIKKDPKFGEQVGKIVVMGGALIVEGNMNHYAEANIFNDPVASNEVFTSNTPFTMVGLDVTHRTTLTKADTQKWRELGTASGKAFADIVDYYITWETTHQPVLTGCALHDPLAVAVAVHPEFVTTLKLPMKVGTTKEDWGRTIADTGKLNDPNAANVEVAVDVKVKDFVDNFNTTLTELFSKH